MKQRTLIAYTLHLADNVLILGQRNAEWCGHGPVLEQDIAISNISLDLIGQARHFYQYAAELINRSQKPADPEASEDSLAYLRTENDFRNCLLAEQPVGDWGHTILRQFFFSAFQHLFYRRMQESTDLQLAAIATKASREVSYHLRWSSEWVIRLGDGTEESHQRMRQAIDELWKYTGELFEISDYETELLEAGVAVEVSQLKNEWIANIKDVFDEATLPFPPETVMQKGGKLGRHSPLLAQLLSEMQYLQRTYPGATW